MIDHPFSLPRTVRWAATVLLGGLISVAYPTPGLAQAQWSQGGSGTIYYNGGNVGIGTTTPAAQFQVNGLGAPISSGWNIAQLARFSDGGAGSNSGFVFDTGATGPTGLRGFYVGKGNQQLSFVRFDSSGASAPAVDMTIASSGNVGIGTVSPQYPLSVNGVIQAKEVIVNTGWPDYVFDPNYHLPSLEEVSDYVSREHHLPGIPSQAQVEKNGVSLGDVQSKMLAKIEELTLLLIQEHDRNDRLDHEMRDLERRFNEFRKVEESK